MLGNIDYWQGALTIAPNYIASYGIWQGPVTRRTDMPKVNKTRGLISNKAAQRIKLYTNLLVDCATWKQVFVPELGYSIKFKVNLITLTLPCEQSHPDSYIHENIFKPFIRAWRNEVPELLYIYKAEVQGNGNLHYHVTANTYIHFMRLRNRWNAICKRAGYVNRNGVVNPNSTDVHSVRNIRNLAAYMVAYLTKKDLYNKPLSRWHKVYSKVLADRNREVTHLPKNYFLYIKRRVGIKVWDCSERLKAGKLQVREGNEEYSKVLDYLYKSNIPVVRTDHAVIWLTQRTKDIKCDTLINLYSQYVARIASPV